jgi:glucose-1-phosphate cytidylyltransferase
MVEIGGKPMLWHILNIYASFGHTEFILALGYRAEVIKEYFLNFFAINNDLSVHLKNGKILTHKRHLPNWIIHLIDTGIHTQTGGRIKRLKEWIGNETFMLTYGDGLSNVNLDELIRFHKKHKKLATVTAVHPPARFGGLILDGNRVVDFTEKNQAKEGWINGGFFVLEPQVLDTIADDSTTWEKEPLEQLSADGELMAYFHEGFWQPMDTLREYKQLEAQWQSGNAPWKLWNDDEPLLEKQTSSHHRSDRLSGLVAHESSH